MYPLFILAECYHFPHLLYHPMYVCMCVILSYLGRNCMYHAHYPSMLQCAFPRNGFLLRNHSAVTNFTRFNIVTALHLITSRPQLERASQHAFRRNRIQTRIA